ncbi:MAG: methyltransferase domain-containing protein [Spirochaetales bacterium]|nr:methyltransferase domain-containing protein [Spirochaetales bacterium]
MKGGSTGDGIESKNADWNFGGCTVKHFQEHIEKSIPFYKEGHKLVVALSDFFIKDDSVCYDLGSSLGRLTHSLAEHHQRRGARLVGIEIENEMVREAKKNYKLPNLDFVCDDINVFKFEETDLIVAYYTVQFIRPSQRQQLVNNIFSALKWGGAFIMFEKVRACDARFQDYMTALYEDYKLEKGYAAAEIINKKRSLKGVLEPFSEQANIDMLKRAGFIDILSIMKYICFEGFLAIK